ncbi:MAG: polyphosphate kinase 1 [Bacteroidota bacterium]|nr:polyphosphate kinase 1 [Bacteroidota bacterium]
MIKNHKGNLYKDREISWLHFNERVLQEAENPETPLMERLKFMAIFSSNLDEFYRVRVAQIRRLQRINGKKNINEYQASPDEILAEIQRIVLSLQDRFTAVYETQIIPELNKRNIYLKEEHELNDVEKLIVKNYFKNSILNNLFPIIIDELKQTPHLRDRSIYLAVRMKESKSGAQPKHAIIEIPTGIINRFYSLPINTEYTHIIFLENILRVNLHLIFSIFDYQHFESYIIKLTRDAEYEISKDETDYSVSLLDKIQKSLKQRSKGIPTRFVYDEAMPKEMLEFLVKKLDLKHVNLIAGGRYHNFKDFMEFPKIGSKQDYFEPLKHIPIKNLDAEQIMFDAISREDIITHHPYQSFDYVIRLLRESAIDPGVTTILITLYRVARHSNVVNALINAVKNGKKVVVLMELQARFDEESNIYWTNQLQEAGAQVHFGKPGQKVHCKLCLIYRKENNQLVKYAHLSTGNYNGVTARIYSDFSLFTKDPVITEEIANLTDMLFANMKRNFKHLLVAPEFMKKQFLNLIEHEASNAKQGKPAYIIAKMNSLVDFEIIKKLYEASNAGVKISLIVRGICCLVPGINNSSENIQVISIIDRFLEHARVYIFANGGHEKIYLASADWMSRNLNNRIECAFPIYNEKAKKFVRDIINLQLSDQIKARKIDGFDDNSYVKKDNTNLSKSSQQATYEFIEGRRV